MPAIGKKNSKETISKIKKSKALRLKSKYKWDIVEPYLDVKLNNGSRNRSKKFITLREFKELIEYGNDLIQLKKSGISKHLIGFYSSFSQGKIKLSKEKFIEEYNKGISLFNIAEKYKIEDDSLVIECECGSTLFRANLRDGYTVVSCINCSNEIVEMKEEEENV